VHHIFDWLDNEREKQNIVEQAKIFTVKMVKKRNKMQCNQYFQVQRNVKDYFSNCIDDAKL